MDAISLFKKLAMRRIVASALMLIIAGSTTFGRAIHILPSQDYKVSFFHFTNGKQNGVALNVHYKKSVTLGKNQVVPLIVFRLFVDKGDSVFNKRKSESINFISFHEYFKSEVASILENDLQLRTSTLLSPIMYKTDRLRLDTLLFEAENVTYQISGWMVEEFYSVISFTERFPGQSNASIINVSAPPVSVKFEPDSLSYSINGDIGLENKLYKVKSLDSNIVFIKTGYLNSRSKYLLFSYTPGIGITHFISPISKPRNSRGLPVETTDEHYRFTATVFEK